MIQCRLAQHQDLQGAHAIYFDASQAAQLFQHRRMHVLRVLYDQQADAAHRGLVVQEALEQAAAIGLVVVFEAEAELAQDFEQEIPRTDLHVARPPGAARHIAKDLLHELAQLRTSVALRQGRPHRAHRQSPRAND